VVSATGPVTYSSATQTVGFLNGTSAGQVLTWNGANWVAAVPATVTFSLDNMQPWLGVNYIIALFGVFPTRQTIYDPTIGEITMFAGTFAPREWAYCDGQLLAVSQNMALFSVLGTNFGGNGQTTFGLPDLRGRVPVHAGSGAGPGLTLRTLGEKGGSQTVSR
jgi:microcystin-dependent protein